MTTSGRSLSAEQQNRFKQQAAEYALQFVQSGMVVGLGGGTTASFAVRGLAQLLREGKLRNILGIPCSSKVETEVRQLGISLTTLEAHPAIDVTIDGADEVDPELNLIKGGGGALLHEKIVAQASRREIIIVDESKPSPRLGTHWPLPVEVVPFGWGAQIQFLKSLGGRGELRQGHDGKPFQTDSGNWIIDCHFGPIANPTGLANRLAARAGIVEHGLFLGLATDLIIAGPDGIRHEARAGS